MIINEHYYEKENTVRITFSLKYSATKLIKYKFKGDIWSYNSYEEVIYSEVHYTKRKVIRERDLDKCESNILYYKNLIKNKEGNRYSEDRVRRNARELEAEENRLEKYKLDIEFQKEVFAGQNLGEFNSSEGYILLYIETTKGDYEEKILPWKYREDYKDGKKEVFGVKKEYEDNINMKSILQIIRGRTEI